MSPKQQVLPAIANDERALLLGVGRLRVLTGLIDAIFDAAAEAYASPFGEDRIDNSRVQSSSNGDAGRRIVNAATERELRQTMRIADDERARLRGVLERELRQTVHRLDVERARLRIVLGLDEPPDRKRGPYAPRRK